MQLTLAGRSRPLMDRAVLVLLATITLSFALTALWLTRSFSPLRGDSAQYLYFDPSRTVGYPAFLEFIRVATGHVWLAVPIQLLILALSLLVLAWSFHRLVRRPAFTLAFQLLLIANAGMWLASSFLMTEGLSTALVALWCAQILHMIRDPRARYRGLLAISCVATMVRPSLLPLFFGSALFFLVARPMGVRSRALALTGVCLIAAWAATPLAQFAVHKSTQTGSPFARGVLQHTLYCDQHTPPIGADAAFIEATAAPVRRYIEAAPPSMQEQLRREYSTPLRFGMIIPVLGRRHDLAAEWQTDSYLASVAEQRVLANPACYAGSVANEYLRLAAFDTDPTAEDAREVNAFMRQHPPVEVSEYPVLPDEARIARRAGSEIQSTPAGLNPAHREMHVKGDLPLIALLPLRLLYAAAALIGAVALMSLLPTLRADAEVRPLIGAGAALGLALHGILAVTAIVEIGFYRYLVPCWPITCTLIVLAVMIIRRSPPLRKLRSSPAAHSRHADLPG